MKVSKAQAAEHRAAIVAAAARLFRERGFDGVGVAEIMRAAGLTHGGFYGHFASKEALAAEASSQAFDETRGRMSGLGDSLTAYVGAYLAEHHRDNAAEGCPMAALACDAARQPAGTRDAFAEGIGRSVEALTGQMAGWAHGPTAADDRREMAIVLLSALVGGMALARATAASAPVLSDEILATLRGRLGSLVAERLPDPG